MEEEKLELMQRLEPQSEELWGEKYEFILQEMSHINLQIKLKDDKINQFIGRIEAKR